MSGTAPGRRSGYKLIPQSNSDNSELSDEELSGFYRDGFQIITRKGVHFSESTPKSKTVKNYTDIMHSEANDAKLANRALSTFTNQETPLQSTSAMSIKRKVSFSFSIFTLFFIIALFLAVPCQWANCSCKSSENETRELWKTSIPNIELIGHVVVIYTKDWFNMNFLLMARGSIFADAPVIRTNYTSSSGGDIIAFHGLTGQQLWLKHYNKMPSEIDCKIFSVQNRSPKDCLIISYGNYVTVISSENGRPSWNLSLNIRNNKTKDVFPIIIPDVDGDNVLDLVLMKDINKIQLVSGFNGAVLNGDLNAVSHNCTEISDLRMHNESLLKLNCKRENNFVEMDLPLQAHLTQTSRNSKQILPQHHSFADLNRMYVHNYTAEFNNKGILCPKNCKAQIRIKKAKEVVWFYKAENSYVMTPVVFDLNYSARMFGFVIKTWAFEREYTSSRSHETQKLTGSFLSEQIFVILFNSSLHEPIHIINMTSNPIVQLYDVKHESVQPDPKMQQHSLIIDDVSRNGSRHLVTYYSSFETKNRDEFPRTLKSYILMYDLLKEIKRKVL